MQVKVSKTMAKSINSYFNDNGISYRAEVIEMAPRSYDVYVGNSVMNDEDFDMETNMMKVIIIDYPSEYYAMPRYLSTRELRSIYYNSNRTMNGFMDELFEEIEI